ncbi:hypothetical protein EMIT0111MI5_180043 [Burkholderia sp. IT-111MI5]
MRRCRARCGVSFVPDRSRCFASVGGPLTDAAARAIRDNLHVALSLRFLESIGSSLFLRRTASSRRMPVNKPRDAVAPFHAVVGTSKPKAQPLKAGQ